MSNESVRGGGVKQHSSGVKHFLKLVKKNLGGLPPYPPPLLEIHLWCITAQYILVNTFQLGTRTIGFTQSANMYVKTDTNCLQTTQTLNPVNQAGFGKKSLILIVIYEYVL